MTKVLYFLRSDVYLSWPLNSFLTFDKARYLHNLYLDCATITIHLR